MAAVPGSVLQSNWEGLSDHLIASLYEVKKNPDGTVTRVSGPTVRAPIVGDSQIEYTLSWQSPFENVGPESKLPALTAMLQAGALQPVANQISQVYRDTTNAAKTLLGIQNGEDAGAIIQDQANANEALRMFEGRTGMTRLNSTQVFMGMPPVKFQITLLFRAFLDSSQEVEAPLRQLLQWALPEELSRDGVVVSGLKAVNGAASNDAVDLLLPSKAPRILAFSYRGRTYAPVVIESIGEPITSPCTSSGGYASAQIPLNLGTLTAMDAPEMAAIRRSETHSRSA